MAAKVLMIYFSPFKGNKNDQTTRMRRINKVKVKVGQGIEGDRYPHEGAYPNDGTRDLTLIAIEDIDAANEGFPKSEHFFPADTRRQIVTQGIDLKTLVNTTFKIGCVWVRYARECEPCDRPSILIGKPGFKERFTNRGGIRVNIINNGEICEGDKINSIC